MKKLIMFLAIICLYTNTLSITASTIQKNDNEETHIAKKSDGFTYYSERDRKIYRVEREESTINIYDNSSNQLLVSAKFDTSNLKIDGKDNILSFDEMDRISYRKPYDSWGSFVFLQNTHLHIGSWSNITIGVLSAMFTGWLGFGTVASGASALVQSAATEFYNNRYGVSDAYAEQYIASNSSCNILDKFKNLIYSDSSHNKYVTTGYTVSWLGNPNDPGTDERCKDVSRYW